MTLSKPQISLYKQAQAGLNSLFVQTAQVSLGLIAMLVFTGGNPPGWMVSTSFFLGIGFVAWSESKRQSKFKVQIKNEEKARPKASLKNVLIKEINNGRQQPQNLQYADLSGADINGANLIGANLRFADLRNANLSGANLSHANLIGASLKFASLRFASLRFADLIDADLSGADLSGASLRNADLRNADLNNTKVENARFGYNPGISKLQRQNLIQRGAIFDDSPPGDRSKVFSR